MSIKVMAFVWEHSKAQGTELLCLLALADFANDEGIAYPGIKRLAQKCRVGERAIQKVLAKLKEVGEIEIEYCEGLKTTTGHTNRYLLKHYREGVNAGTPQAGERGEPQDTPGVNVGTPKPSVTTTLSNDSAPDGAIPSLVEEFHSVQEQLRTCPPKERTVILLWWHSRVFGKSADPPKYSRIGGVAKEVGGAGRLAELMFQCATRPPSGDPLTYIQGIHKGKAQHRNGNAAKEVDLLFLLNGGET